MKARSTYLIAALCLFSPCVRADGPRLELGGRQLRQPTNERRRLIAETDGFRLYTVPPELRVARARVRVGQGRGGDVAELSTTQVAYSDPTSGNVALLVWDEATPNSSGVNVLVNDLLIGTVEGLAEPGANSVFLEGFPRGLFMIKVESIDDGSTSEAMQMIVETQPFADPTNIQCGPGSVTGPDACSLDVTWENPGPAPDVYILLLNGVTLGTVPGDEVALTVENAPPGPYTVTLVGFDTAEDGNGEYRGHFVETSCSLDCQVAAPIETPTAGEFGLLGLLTLLFGLGCWILRRRPETAATRRA